MKLNFSSPQCSLQLHLTVTVNSSAGNFCIKTFGISHRFLALSGICCAYNLNALPVKNAQVCFGFACHCHCNPNFVVLNSSDSTGLDKGNVFPTSGFLYHNNVSPLTSLSSYAPITL